jgi:hypothetical protein
VGVSSRMHSSKAVMISGPDQVSASALPVGCTVGWSASAGRVAFGSRDAVAVDRAACASSSTLACAS